MRTKFILISSILLLALTGSIQSQSFKFIGPGIDYTDVNNWENGDYPGLTISVGEYVRVESGLSIAPGVNIIVEGIFGMVAWFSIDIQNQGSIQVSSTGLINSIGSQTPRTIINQGGTIDNNGEIRMKVSGDGTISGNGEFADIFCEDCHLEPGGALAIGKMTVNKLNLRQDYSVSFDIENANSSDTIFAACLNCLAMLGDFTRTLHVNFLNGYTPDINSLNSFAIFDGLLKGFTDIVYGAIEPIYLSLDFINENGEKLTILSESLDYNFVGPDSVYTEPSNWESNNIYGGYPGTDVGLNEHISISSKCYVPADITLNLDCTLGANAEFVNAGIVNFTNEEENITIGIKNTVSGIFNISGQLYVDGNLTNYGELTVTQPGFTVSSPFHNLGELIFDDVGQLTMSSVLTNDGIVRVESCAYIFGSTDIINNITGSIINWNRINPHINNAGQYNSNGACAVKLYGSGTIEGEGQIDTILCEGCTIMPGGENNTGKFVTRKLILDEESILKIEIGDYPETEEFDRIQILDGVPPDDQQYIGGTLDICNISNLPITTCLEYSIIDRNQDTLLGDFQMIDITGFGANQWSIENPHPPEDFGIKFSLTPGENGNNALDFDGIDDYIQVNQDIGPIHTLEFKFFPEKVDPNLPGDNILSLDNNSGRYIWTMRTSSSIDNETMSLLNGGNWIYTDYLFEKEWYHVAFVSEGTSGVYEKIYVNGVEVTSFTHPIAPGLFDMEDFRIGSRRSYPQGFIQGFFNGRMDEFRFWNITRSASQISDNWDKELEPSDTQGLKAYYKMNQGRSYQDNSCVNQMKDYSVNENEGILNGFVLNNNTGNWVRAEACPSFVSKISNTFNGNGDGSSWFDVDNWELDEVPTTCHHAIIPSGFDVELDGVGALCYTIDVQGTIDVESVSSLESYAPKQ